MLDRLHYVKVSDTAFVTYDWIFSYAEQAAALPGAARVLRACHVRNPQPT